jgi:hypothetical protein
LLQTGQILKAATNCSFISLAALMDYGNWCGLGNNNRPPVDELDSCCKVRPTLQFATQRPQDP